MDAGRLSLEHSVPAPAATCMRACVTPRSARCPRLDRRSPRGRSLRRPRVDAHSAALLAVRNVRRDEPAAIADLRARLTGDRRSGWCISAATRSSGTASADERRSRGRPPAVIGPAAAHHTVPEPMPKITYIGADGTSRTVEAEIGSTVMETAIKHGVPGIEAECGGACACATCHVYVDEAWRAIVGEPSPMEEDMLDFGYDVKPNSRLSCQIKVTAEIDGLVVRVPERQA